jgi:ribosomal protein S18 acetylase RimI-like enzyme
MMSELRAAHDVTDPEWEAIRALFVHTFVTLSASVSVDALALMGHHPEKFWGDVFDADQPRAREKNYTFSLSKERERLVAYGLYTYVSHAQYLYIHHFVVHPDYQGQGIGKRLMHTMQELHGDAKKVGLLTRPYNIQALNFYKRLGFSASVDVPAVCREYYSSERVYLERSLT